MCNTARKIFYSVSSKSDELNVFATSLVCALERGLRRSFPINENSRLVEIKQKKKFHCDSEVNN